MKKNGVLNVAVMVELFRGADAGGQVKCWERFAEAACGYPGDLDLTVFFLGRPARKEMLADNVNLEALSPVLPTDRIPGLPQVAPVTDMAPIHPALYRRLADFDVLHVTHAFAFAMTARRFARWRGSPLVTSIHADLPTFARVYVRDIVKRRFGAGVLTRALLERLRFDEACATAMIRRVSSLVAVSDGVLIGRQADLASLSVRPPPELVSRLRRGVDRGRFNPARRDRSWLAAEFGVPEDVPVLLFAGRIDDSKNVMILAQAARRLLDQGQPLHVFAAGNGIRQRDVRRLLGAHATLPGMLEQETLARVFASADLFVFPSESEIMPNAVLEARASGLPVVLSARDNGAQFIAEPGVDGVLVAACDAEAWAVAVRPLLADVERRTAMALATRHRVEKECPTWAEVLAEDLLPVWRRVAVDNSLPRVPAHTHCATTTAFSLQNPMVDPKRTSEDTAGHRGAPACPGFCP
jgi:glycosyltransferase involved in cell wall biosynthesis